MAQAGSFLQCERLELSSGVYRLRLTKYWIRKLKNDYDIDALAFYRAALLGNQTDPEMFGNTIGGIFFAELNAFEDVFTEKQASDIAELAMQELGAEAFQTKIYNALSMAFMTKDQYDNYQQVLKILRDPDIEEEVKKLMISKSNSLLRSSISG
ncbi:hypothetical protein [Listeria ilorinensis]|uniref:hypothetical protein n=1 Tax=Listeria ilorinensis TaxID=2867439 RepID=UPI001EF6190E|nr:hypothetical protein [Listeria ilorinensis]